MIGRPVGFAIGPPFWARLALVLPDPVDQLEWSRQQHDNEVGAELIECWNELFDVPTGTRHDGGAWSGRPGGRSSNRRDS